MNALFSNVNRILRLARQVSLRAAKEDRIAIENRLQNIRISSGYAAKLYAETKDEPILIGNWNAPSSLSEEAQVIWDRFVKSLEKSGASLEWEDSCDTCSDCGRAVETQPSHAWWTPGYKIIGHDIVCHHCIVNNPSEYLESIEERPVINDVNINFARHGYVKVNSETYKTDPYLQLLDSPAQIIKDFHSQGLKRFFLNQVARNYTIIEYEVYVSSDEPLAFL